MSSLDLTREWLHTVLRPYASKERIISEVMDILTLRRSLAVKTDAFTLLLLLHGTLPVTFRGATYQIPMHVWIPHDYPRSPPLAFVVPTKDMAVRKGREVEPGGRVREEIVEDWWRGWEPAEKLGAEAADDPQPKTIETLLKHLGGIFSATPPVYARPPDSASSPSRPPPNVGGPSQMSPSNTGQNGWSNHRPPARPPPPPAKPMLPQPDFLPQYASTQTPPPNPYAQHPQYPQHPHSRQSSASYSQPPDPNAGRSTPPVPQRPAGGIPPRQGSLPGSPLGPVMPDRAFPGRPLQPQMSGTGERPRTPPRPYAPPPNQVLQYPPAQSLGYNGVENGNPGQYSQQPMTSGSSNQYEYAHQPYHAGIPPPQMHAPTGYQQPYPPQHSQSPPPVRGVGSPHSGQMPDSQYYQSQPQQQLQQQPPIPQPAPPPPASQPAKAAPAIRQPAPDLLSSPSDDLPNPLETSAPPPLPPSKPPPPSTLHLHSILLPHLQASLPPLLQSLHTSRNQLIERKEDLTSGEPAIRDEMARLEAVRKVCDSTGKKLDDVVRRGQERVAELEQRGEVGVDEVVCGISIVHNQLIDLVAEDNALEDTIYHVTRAHDQERIDLDRFLKSIRILAREQYMKRALIERILQGMGQSQGW